MMMTEVRPLPFVLAAMLAMPLAAQAPATERQPELFGHLREHQGVRILFLRGEARERGFTEGYLLAEELRELIRKFALSERFIPRPGLWNLLVVPQIRRRVVVPDWVREHAEGVIDGILARDEELLEIPELRRELTVDDVIGMATLPDFIGLACSSFVAWGDRAKGEGPLVGRNLDYFATPELLKHTMIIVNAPRGDRAGWVSIGWPGIAGLLTGFSSAGVSVAIHDVFARAENGQKITPRIIALQELIERLKPGEDPAAQAAAILREFRYGMGGNAMVAWNGETPGGAVFEFDTTADDDGGVTLRRAAESEPFVACSNHHRSRTEPRQCWRYQKLYDGLGAVDAPGIDLDSGWELLGGARVERTLYQSLIDLSTGEFRIALRRAPRADEWQHARGLDVRALIAEAERGSASSTRER